MQLLKNKVSKWIATCFGLGYFPRAPGTSTSLVALSFWAALAHYQIPLWGLVAICVVLIPLGVWAIRIYAGDKDPSEVVIDEWVGMGIALFPSTYSLPELALGFVLFRAFDILKPLGVQYFDRRSLKGWGVMLDDVLAGLYAGVGVFAYRWFLV